MMAKFQPMLAKAFEEKHAKWPMYASPKLDGVRAIIKDGVVLTRSLKPVRNKYIQSVLGGKSELEGLDGELVVGKINAPNVFQLTQSGQSSEDGEPDFKFVVFDYWNMDCGYNERLPRLQSLPNRLREMCNVAVLGQQIIFNKNDLDECHKKFTDAGFEGTIVRSITGNYKFGRSTAREGLLLKYVDWEYEEAVIIGFEELMHNNNPLTLDERGYAERSSHSENLVSSGMLGAFVVKSDKYVDVFKISAGSMSLDERRELWETRFAFTGKLLRYKHKPHGQKDVPRHGLFAGFRDSDDMS